MCRISRRIKIALKLKLHCLVKYEKTPTFKVSHWPFIPTGVLVNGSVTFTPGKLM